MSSGIYREANYDTANPPYIRKYLRTYGLTPPRAESYEVQKTRCRWNLDSGAWIGPVSLITRPQVWPNWP